MKMSLQCHKLTDPNPLAVSLAAVILVGILVSYIPQHAKIIKRRSSEGLSPWWVLLGGLSSIAAIANILVLPASRRDVACCKELKAGECAAALLGVGQIGLQWACFMFIVMLFLIFFPTEPSISVKFPAASLTKTPPAKRRDAIIVGISVLLALLVMGSVSVTMVANFPGHTQGWADTLGSVAGILAMIQYVPQIYETWRLGDVKSLSIVTMIIQVPGAFLFAFSLFLRVSWEGWSTWFVYLVTGVLQGTLLTLAIKYNLANRKLDSAQTPSLTDDTDDIDEREESIESDERSGLLKADPSSPIHTRYGTQRSHSSNRSLSMLYAATPPDNDSDRSVSVRG